MSPVLPPASQLDRVYGVTALTLSCVISTRVSLRLRRMPTAETRFQYFPRTTSPPDFITAVVEVFRGHLGRISTINLEKGLTSDEVLSVIRPELVNLGFDVEQGKRSDQKIHRPVFFGEGGEATLKYEVDGYHREWRCGLEVEAGRAWMGNAVYRDLIQAMVMVEVECLVLAVPIAYKYKSGGKTMTSSDFQNTLRVAETLFGHSRLTMPYDLAVIGY